MFGLILYLTLVGAGTGYQIHEKIQERKLYKKNRSSAPTPQTTCTRSSDSSDSSGSSSSSGYTPILDSPDFYMTFGGN